MLFKSKECEKNKENEIIKRPFFIIRIAFPLLALILAVALVFSLVTIRKRNKTISAIKAEITQNEALIEESKAKITEFEAAITQKDTENSETKVQLEAAQSEKQRLEDENGRLKAEIQNLKAASAQAPSPVPIVLPGGDKVCYLTFDDGPSNNTLTILDILNRYGIKATFFVTATGKTEYIKNIYEAGHTVGLHTASHVYSSIYASEDAYFSDLDTVSGVVESITGTKSKVIRFPGGSSNLVSATYCPGLMTRLVGLVGERGYSYFDWNVSSGDAESTTPSYTSIRNNVLKGSKGKDSVCVLMHDSSAKTTTAQALSEIIEGLSGMGFRFEAITHETNGFHHSKLNN